MGLVLTTMCPASGQEVIKIDDDDEKETPAKPSESDKKETPREEAAPEGVHPGRIDPPATEAERELVERINEAMERRIPNEGDQATRRKAVLDKLDEIRNACYAYLKAFPEGGVADEVTYRLAWTYYQLRIYGGDADGLAKALEVAAGLIADKPKSEGAGKAHALRLRLFRAQRKYPDAIKEAEALVKDFASDIELASSAQYHLYDLHRRLRNREKAQAALKTVAEKYPETVWGRKAQGLLARTDMPGKVIDIDFAKADGTALKLSAYRGKVVLVVYWATGRNSSMPAQERVKKLYDLYARDGFVVIGVNLDQDRKAFEEAQAKLNAPWVQCHDGKGFNSPSATRVGVSAVPSNVLIDREGRVHSFDIWQTRILRPALVKLLGEK